MKFISRAILWLLFTVLFFCVVLPVGYFVKRFTDPHRLVIRKGSASYFNRRSTRETTGIRNKESIHSNANA
ncbi:MAG: hypothetical protein JWP80_2515 [Pseudomonas sp.]|nr:hypothetical protein [Pseudomonas sp.]